MKVKKIRYQQQGDVVAFEVDALPTGLKRVEPKSGRYVLAEGEATGHCHAIADLENVDVFVAEDGTLFMDVKETVTLVHEEHHQQTIKPGKYRVGRVREIDPFTEETRAVKD